MNKMAIDTDNQGDPNQEFQGGILNNQEVQKLIFSNSNAVMQSSENEYLTHQ